MTDDVPADRTDVAATYDRIAPHFAAKRENPWPEVVEFLDGRSATRALDVGCANGRHTELLAAVADRVLGIDVSRELLHEARTRRADHEFDADLLLGDAVALPVRRDAVDLALAVATIHHLPDRRTRRRSLDELARVLAPGSPALVSVWSTEHERFDRAEGFDTTVPFSLPDGTAVKRFYHIYDPGEFEADLEASALDLERSWVSHGNCYAVVAGTKSA